MSFWTLRFERVCLQSWTDKKCLHSSWTDTESCGSRSEEKKKKKLVPSLESRGRSRDALLLQPRLSPPPRPPTSRYGVSRPQSALCCSVLFTLFVVLNLIVINIFDLLCIWQAYLLKKKKKKMLCMVGASFWNVLIRIPLFWDFPPSFSNNSISNKAKVQFYCTGATTDFCVDNQWCFGLKSQTNKRYLRWRDLRCKEKYSLVNGERDTARLKAEQRVKSLLFDSFIRNQQE